jgi:hypothetical protein
LLLLVVDVVLVLVLVLGGGGGGGGGIGTLCCRCRLLVTDVDFNGETDEPDFWGDMRGGGGSGSGSCVEVEVEDDNKPDDFWGKGRIRRGGFGGGTAAYGFGFFNKRGGGGGGTGTGTGTTECCDEPAANRDGGGGITGGGCCVWKTRGGGGGGGCLGVVDITVIILFKYPVCICSFERIVFILSLSKISNCDQPDDTRDIEVNLLYCIVSWCGKHERNVYEFGLNANSVSSLILFLFLPICLALASYSIDALFFLFVPEVAKWMSRMSPCFEHMNGLTSRSICYWLKLSESIIPS